MAINLFVAGRQTVPTREDMYSYLALIKRYENTEIRGKVYEFSYQESGVSYAFISIDVMAGLHDRNLYALYLLDTLEREDKALGEILSLMTLRLRKWSKANLTFVEHFPAATLAILENIRPEAFSEVFDRQEFPLTEHLDSLELETVQ